MGIASLRGRALTGRSGATAAICLVALSGCSADKVLDAANPVNWYRDLTGVSKNDPNAEAANNANLEAGSKEPYPDLGSVPNEPTRGLTEEQRNALAQGLVADRDNAHYTDDLGRAGNAGATMPAQSSVPEEQLAYAGGPVAPTPPPAPSATATVAAPPVAGSSNLAIGGALAPSVAPPPARIPVGASSESSLRTPTPRATPQPQTPNSVPGSADLKPLPPAGPQGPFPNAPAGHPEPPPGPDQVAGVPVPPAAPVRGNAAANPPAFPAAGPVDRNTQAGPTGKYAHASQVAQVKFQTGSATLSAADSGELGKVPALHKQYGGVVRIVGYAASGGTAGDVSSQHLAAYQAALDHANAVKAALIRDGVPASEIVTEASPERDNTDAAERADIYVEY